MASTFSFDFVSEIDLQEADNAVNQAKKEIDHRYDLRGSNCDMEFERNQQRITIKADGEHFVNAARDILIQKMIKRGISVQALDEDKPEMLGGVHVRQYIKLRSGIEKEQAKKITSLIKDSKIKVTTQIMDEKVRVTGKSKDDLQEVINLVKGAELDFPVQTENFR